MKRPVSAGVVALALVVSAVFAWGEGSPVVLTHTLTGYSRTGKTVTLEYAVQVQNREAASLGALSLTLVPNPPFVSNKTTVAVGNLGPKAVTTVHVKTVTSLDFDEDAIAEQPLLWAGKYTSSSRRIVEFPATSLREVPNARP